MTRKISFNTAKITFSTGTQIACPRPVKTLSWSTKITQPITVTPNSSARRGFSRNAPSEGDQKSTPRM